MMKLFRISVISAAFAGLFSCILSSDEDNQVGNNSKESPVEVSVIADASTKALGDATPDEKAIEDLDVLLFDAGGKFVCWRTTYKVNGKLRTTLPIGSGYDVHFLANCRDAIWTMLPDDNAVAGHKGISTWETFRTALIDGDPARLLQDGTSFKVLPMWGLLKGQEVKDQVINKWPPLSLIRSVASVDVYVNSSVTEFLLRDVTLYNVPDKGFMGNSPANIQDDKATSAVSPSAMTTSLTLASDKYDAAGRSIANRLYLYDNDVTSTTATASKKHTRLVIGAEYKNTKYYYPVDFEDTDGGLAQIIRNRKYLFMINSVSGPGYGDKDTAAEQPSVNLNVNVVEWDMEQGQIGVSGPYYLWLEKRRIYLPREANTYRYTKAESNIPADQITLNFKTDNNGVQSAVTNGIKNDSFLVEKQTDTNGNLLEIKVTALKALDETNTSANSDVVVMRSGRIEVELIIDRADSGDNDWHNGGNQGTDLGA